MDLEGTYLCIYHIGDFCLLSVQDHFEVIQWNLIFNNLIPQKWLVIEQNRLKFKPWG